MKITIKHISFDLDGTLYPDYVLWIALGIPFMLKHGKTVSAIGSARRTMRNDLRGNIDFKDLQADLVAKKLNKPFENVKFKIDAAYNAWEKAFFRVKPFSYVLKTLTELKDKGFTLSVFSDFPAQKKIQNIGLSHLFDYILTSESSGYLKPHQNAFTYLSETVQVKPENILYIGDSLERDVIGAKNAGMFTALLSSKKQHSNAIDIQFSNYKDLPYKIESFLGQ